MNIETLKEYRSWLVSAAIVIAIALWLATGSDTDTASPMRADAETAPSVGQFSVRVRRQVAEEVVRTITVNGQSAPARTVEISAETDGRVVETGVDRGERVSEGGVIVRLEMRDRQERLTQAKATLEQRKVEYEARQRLKAESYVSEAQLAEGAALLEAARAEVRRAELDIQDTYVRAPFDGALQERHVEIGDFVKAGEPIATYVDDRSIIITAAVSEFDAAYVSQGQEASARLATGEEVTGIVRYVAPAADEATRTFTVELAIDNEDGRLRAGMSAELIIPAETIFAHRLSPSLLTLNDAGDVGIKIVNDEGLVEFHRANIALTTPDGIYVSGLPTAATIITVGQGFVTEGSYVDSVPEDAVEQAVAIKSSETAER